MADQYIDYHHHLWDIDAGTYLWLEEDPEETAIVGDYSAIRRYDLNSTWEGVPQ